MIIVSSFWSALVGWSIHLRPSRPFFQLLRDPFLHRSQGGGQTICDNGFDENVDEVGDTLETRNSFSVFPRPDTMADLGTDLASGLRRGRKKEGIHLYISTRDHYVFLFDWNTPCKRIIKNEQIGEKTDIVHGTAVLHVKRAPWDKSED